MSLVPTVNMMCDMTRVIVDMERTGIAIDRDELHRLKEQFSNRLKQLEDELNALATKANGGIPINLNSPEQKSMLIFSRRVTDKKKWAEVWNVGSEQRGSVKKKKRQFHYKPAEFVRIVKALTEVVPQYAKQGCGACNATGKLNGILGELRCVNGHDRCYDGPMDGCIYCERKPRRNCPECHGEGFILSATNKVAGFRCVPTQDMVSALGFSTDKGTLEELAKTANGEAKEFLTRVGEYNKISHYLSTFILPIENNTRADGLLHTQFMQTVTATGRLSSQNPNYHNQPRGDKFPIRRVVVSRFRGGYIGEGDYAQLEFRVAVELANDPVGLQDILEKVDAHARTSKIVSDAGQPTNRQDAKPLTFKPLYGGSDGTEAEKVYFDFFFKRYPRILEWHKELCNLAISKRIITLPSGRELAFPNTIRYPSGTVSGATQIKNYPVQSFATADVVPIATIEVYRLFKINNLQSVIINEVHDSIVADIHPDEKDIARELMWEGMMKVPELVKARYGIDLKVPLEVELKIGVNWLDLKPWE